MSDNKEIRDLLNELGVPYGVDGRTYISDAIGIVMERPLASTVKDIYTEIAQKHDTTTARVERAIRHAIELTFSRGNFDAQQRRFKNTIDPDKGKMTNRAFIDACADALR